MNTALFQGNCLWHTLHDHINARVGIIISVVGAKCCPVIHVYQCNHLYIFNYTVQMYKCIMKKKKRCKFVINNFC